MTIGKDGRPSEEHIARTREIEAALLPALRMLARRHGYALAVHGSRERDLDLVAIPWREGAIDPVVLVEAIRATCEAVLGFATWPHGWKEGDTFAKPEGAADDPVRKPHGRMGWSIILSGGPYLDISVMPPVPA